jgi:hypothetical protein
MLFAPASAAFATPMHSSSVNRSRRIAGFFPLASIADATLTARAPVFWEQLTDWHRFPLASRPRRAKAIRVLARQCMVEMVRRTQRARVNGRMYREPASSAATISGEINKSTDC